MRILIDTIRLGEAPEGNAQMNLSVQLLSEIIQGEGGICGPAGMMAVAMSLSCRIWQHGHSMKRIAAEYFGRAEPGPVATLLAELVAGRELPDNPYYYCMGGRPDVKTKGWPEGDVVVRVGKDSIHLYRDWPEEKNELSKTEQ